MIMIDIVKMSIFDWLLPESNQGNSVSEDFFYVILSIFVLGLVWFAINAVTTFIKNIAFWKMSPSSLTSTLIVVVISVPLAALLAVLLDRW